MGRIAKSDTELGKKYGKPDIERLGIFSEMPFVMVGTKYDAKKTLYPKGLNMCPGAPKTKCGNQDGYFQKPFLRIFEGEGKGKTKRIKAHPDDGKRPFYPAGCGKKQSCPGDYFGTFGGKVDALGTAKKKVKPPPKPGRNMYPAPLKEGGPGYPDICFDKYPEHSNDRYGAKPKYKIYGKILNGPMYNAHYTKEYFDNNPFADSNGKIGPTYVRPKDKPVKFLGGRFIPTGPGKSPGGCHAACFDQFSYSSNRFYTAREVEKILEKKWRGKTKLKQFTSSPFYPQSYAPKLYYTQSVVYENIDFRVNVNNYQNYQPSYTRYLLK